MSKYLQTNKPKRMRVPKEANWGQAYTIYRRTGMDHADAAYRADERDKIRDRARALRGDEK